MVGALKNIAKSVILLLFVANILIDSADGAEKSFYSINIATVKSLKEVSRHINSLKFKDQMVFWEKSKIQGTEQFYRVYLGRYESWLSYYLYVRQTIWKIPLGI